MIGVSLTLNWNPRFFNSRLKNFVLAHNFLTRRSPSGESSRVKAAWQAAAVAGGCEVEKRKGLARKYKKSIRSREPQTYPPIAPMAFLRVPARMCMRPRGGNTTRVLGAPRRDAP